MEHQQFNATHAASFDRSRPIAPIVFKYPLIGPSGASLMSYQWVWTAADKVNAHGENYAGRKSDWQQAVTNSATGRDVVHQFTVNVPCEGMRIVSAETAVQLLGFSGLSKMSDVLPSLVSATKTLAKLQMKLVEAQAQEAKNLRIEAEAWSQI